MVNKNIKATEDSLNYPVHLNNQLSTLAAFVVNGNATFTLRVTDTGQNSGMGSDAFQLDVIHKSGNLYKTVPLTLLSGSNIVVHWQ